MHTIFHHTTIRQDCKWLLCDTACRFYQRSLCFTNITWFKGTRININPSMPVKEQELSNITKLTSAEKHYVYIPIQQISPRLDNDCGLEEHKSFMPVSKVWLSLHHFSWNPPLLKKFLCISPVLKFTKHRKNVESTDKNASTPINKAWLSLRPFPWNS